MTAPRPVGHGAAQVYFRPAVNRPAAGYPNPTETIMGDVLGNLPLLAPVFATASDPAT